MQCTGLRVEIAMDIVCTVRYIVMRTGLKDLAQVLIVRGPTPSPHHSFERKENTTGMRGKEALPLHWDPENSDPARVVVENSN